MLKLVKAGGKPQLTPLDTWPPTHSHWLPVQTAPDTLQTQALPTRVALEWQLAESGIALEFLVPQPLLAVTVQTVLPGLVAGMMPLLVNGAKLTEIGLSPVQLSVAVTVPEPLMSQVAV